MRGECGTRPLKDAHAASAMPDVGRRPAPTEATERAALAWPCGRCPVHASSIVDGGVDGRRPPYRRHWDAMYYLSIVVGADPDARADICWTMCIAVTGTSSYSSRTNVPAHSRGR